MIAPSRGINRRRSSTKTTDLPDLEPSNLPDVFADYFCQKIVQIRSNLQIGIEMKMITFFLNTKFILHVS